MKFEIILLISLVGYFSACHPKQRENRTRKVSPPIEAPVMPGALQPGDEKAYHLYDPNCITSGVGAAEIKESTVFKFVSSKVQKEKFIFNQTRSPVSLESGAISATIFGHSEKADCKLVNGEIACADSIQATSMPQPLKICNPNADYDRNSFEGVALTALSAIEKAQAYYNSFPGHDPKLPRSQLIVLPVIEQRVKFQDGSGQEQTKSIYMTDNMAFMPDLVGKPAFVVFPKGPYLKELGIWQGVNLWESDWVIAHEYGHHVFMHHTDAQKASLQTINVHNIPTHAPFRSVKKQNTSLNLAGKNPPFGAVNEAFADLFAYFSIQQDSAQIEGLDCFRKSRDVSSVQFESGALKKMDNEVLQIFGGLKNPIQSDNLGCGAPDYSELHSVGAIIAHALYSVIKISPVYKNLPAYDGKFGELLLNWPNKLGSLYGSKIVLAPSFEPILKPFFEGLAERQSGSLTPDQCHSIKTNLPALDSSMTKGLCP